MGARSYSHVPLARKLGIKEGSLVHIGAEGYGGRLPRGKFDVIVHFALSKSGLRRDVRRYIPHLEPNGRLWICWPKKTSGIATDLEQNDMWELILPTGLVDNKVAAIDERWTGFQWVVRLKDRPQP